MRKLLVILLSCLALSAWACKENTADTRCLGAWNIERMSSWRASADPDIIAARKALVREADKVLTQHPATILDQEQTAPSGNKHDYYSMARYWWPNPDTEDHLPYVRHDGQNNPETQGLGREALSAFEKQIEILALAYFYTGEAKYADGCMTNLKAWYTDKASYMTPNMEYSQVVLGRDNNHGRHEGVLDSYSMLAVPQILHILEGASCVRQKDVKAIRKWFEQYVNWMTTAPQAIEEDNYYNNHGTAYHIQLIVYAAFAGNDSLADRYIHSFTERRILTQIEPDGRQPKELARTRGFGYSIFNLKHMIDYVDICYSAGYPVLEQDTVARQRILAALDYLTPYLGRPVTAWPWQQINEWDKQQQELCWLIRRAAPYFPERQYDELFKTYNKAKASNRHWLF